MDAAPLGAADGGEKRTGRDSPPWKGHNIGLEVTYYRNSFQAMGAMVTWSASVAADPLGATNGRTKRSCRAIPPGRATI